MSELSLRKSPAALSLSEEVQPTSCVNNKHERKKAVPGTAVPGTAFNIHNMAICGIMTIVLREEVAYEGR